MLRSARTVLLTTAALLAGLSVFGALQGGKEDLVWGLFLMAILAASLGWTMGRVALAREPWRRAARG